MSPKTNDQLPRNATEAQGLLIKAFYAKYGHEILPIIDDILGLQGKALGFKVKSKLQNCNLSTVARSFIKNFDPATVDVVKISDREFHIQGKKCPFGLENTSRELCEVVMAIDREYFSTATNGKTNLQILKTRAAGDEICYTIYTIKD